MGGRITPVLSSAVEVLVAVVVSSVAAMYKLDVIVEGEEDVIFELAW
jgi:hypothetical protein